MQKLNLVNIFRTFSRLSLSSKTAAAVGGTPRHFMLCCVMYRFMSGWKGELSIMCGAEVRFSDFTSNKGNILFSMCGNINPVDLLLSCLFEKTLSNKGIHSVPLQDGWKLLFLNFGYQFMTANVREKDEKQYFLQIPWRRLPRGRISSAISCSSWLDEHCLLVSLSSVWVLAGSGWGLRGRQDHVNIPSLQNLSVCRGWCICPARLFTAQRMLRI